MDKEDRQFIREMLAWDQAGCGLFGLAVLLAFSAIVAYCAVTGS